MIRPLRIAVADDEPDMRDYLKRVLERLGHTVVGPVEDGLKLVELCRKSRPDLVITDVRMPGLNGDQALREIYTVCPVPFIVVTAGGIGCQRDFELDRSSFVFIDKPFRRNDLHNAISQLMT